MKRIKAGILGCTGIVGQQFVRLLDNHPFFELNVLAASPKSVGKRYEDAQQWAVGEEIPAAFRSMEIQETDLESLLKTDTKIFFSALPAILSQELEDGLRNHGCFVFSNVSAHRMDEDVPILIPEINPDHFELARRQLDRHSGFIVTNSNCSASGLVMVLKPLQSFGIQSVAVTTFQSISGAGRRGVAAMDISGNVIPYIKDEEEKVDRETRKILGKLEGATIKYADFPVYASCSRVPVREGHLESVLIEFAVEPEIEAVRNVLAGFSGVPQSQELPTAPKHPIVLRDEEDRPQPALDAYVGLPQRARGMTVTVGRIRKKGRFLSLFLLVHNTIRGAAGTCLLNAELAFRKKCLQ